jgi:hypothetical protein
LKPAFALTEDCRIGEGESGGRLLVKSGVTVEKGTNVVISVNFRVYADEHSITYERISVLKFHKKSFSTATGFIANYGKWATAISNIMPTTMIAQHGNDDYREKAISYLKSRAEGFREYKNFTFLS